MKAAFTPFTSLTTSCATRMVRRVMGLFFAFFLLIPLGMMAQDKPAVAMGDSWTKQTGMYSRFTPNRYSANGIYSGYTAGDELTELRTRDSKTFSNGNGTNDLFYIGRLHYKNENGKWSDIDVSIKQTSTPKYEGYDYQNLTNDFKTYYSTDPTKGFIMDYEGHSYTLAQNYGFSVVANASDPGKAIATQGSLSKSDFRTLKVRNYASGIDYEMIQTSQGVETGFWLRNKSAYQNAASGYLMMEQTIDLPAGCALAVDGKVQKGDFTASSFALLAPNGTPAVTFKKVTLYDAAFSYDEIMQDVEMNALAPQIGKDGKPIADKRDSHRLDVQYVVKREGNQAKVCFLIPVAWLNQPDRLFPVYVDPYYYAENVTTGSTTCTSSYVMYCTYYHDARWDYRISSAALSAAGLTNGATISAMGLLCSATPGRTVANARIDLSNSYSSWSAGTSTWMNSGWQNCYYASSLPTPTVSASTWNNYTFSSSFPYNSSNGGLVFRLTRDDTGYTSGGGHYVTGSTTTDAKSMYSDSGNGAYPFESSSASSSSAYIPCMRLTYSGGAPIVETPCDMWGGSGTASSPYTISNEAGLVCLRNNVNQGISYNGKYFRLTADITLTSSFNTGTSSAPIGSSFAFQGSFDGNNHTISNLNLSAAAASQALFGYTNGAEISNLTVRGTNQGTYQTGGIVGNATNTIIDNCVSYVTFSVSSYQRGGIVGTATGCTISECTNNANFTASYGSGGIVGEATNTQITDCINNGNLTTASYNIGGIVGRMLTGTTVNDCVNYGSITTTSTYSTTSTNYGIGGIVGYSNYGSAVSTAVITNCTNRGSITSTCYLTGGIVGYHYYYGHITYCNNYGNISTTGSPYYVGGIVGRNYGYNSTYPTRIDYCNNYANVNGYEYVGGIAGYTYGYGSSESSNGFVTYCVNSGEVTGRYYYTGGIAGYAYYVQFRNNTNNAIITGTSYYTGGIAGYCYYGYYQQYNINNADITSTSYYTGGIFGRSYYNYYNQYNENRGDVTSGGLYTGGINGYNYGSSYYCRYNLNSGNVSSTSYYVGGINGYAYSTYTDYCVNVGRVKSTYSGNAYVGGITGYATSTSAYTRYCLNAGKVSGYTYVGGIAGEGYYGNYISYCLNVGDVEGTTTGYTAAIAGYAYSGVPDNCYWDKQMCPTEYQYNAVAAPTYAKYTRELIGQNTYPSSSYWYSGTNLYPRPNISNVYNSDIAIVAATPMEMQDAENVGNAQTCFTAYNGNNVTWASANNSLVTVSGSDGRVVGTGNTHLTATRNGIVKEIDLSCAAGAFEACFVAISPADHATAVSYTPTLEWEPINCTSTYNIYIGTTNYFGAATLYGSSNSTSYTVSPALDPNTTYYWWVAPAGMQTVDCTPGSFTTTCGAPPTFTLTADQVTDCNSPVELHVSNVSNVTEWTYGEGVYESGGHIYVNPGHTTTYTVYGSNATCAPAGQSVTVYKNTPEVILTASTESCVEAGTEVTLTADFQSTSQQVSSMNMTPTTTTLTPGTTFSYYDYNGPSASYSNYEDYTQVFNVHGNSPISIVFNDKGAESCCDYMYLYDGPSTSAPVLYSGLLYNVPLNTVYTATSGSLTVHFTSDVSNVGSGWDATISVASSVTYAWSTGSSENEITVSPTESTTYTVTVTDNEYDCPAILDYAVRVIPEVTVTPEGPMVCPNGGTVTLTAQGADSYAWYQNNALVGTNATYTATAGSYQVVGTNDDGCTTTVSVEVTTLATPSAGTLSNVTMCASDFEITLEGTPATGGGNVTYTWQIGNLQVNTTTPTYTLTAADREALGTGTFNVTRTFTDACNNQLTTPAAQLTINPAMAAPSITGNTNLLCGQSTTLTAHPAYQSEHFIYRWYSDAEGQNLVYEGPEFQTPSISENTTYYLQVRDEHIQNEVANFTYTGSEQTYTIPAGVSQVTLEVWGAQGGGQQVDGNTNLGIGGNGGYSVGTMPVNGGETIYVYVGGQGGTSNSSSEVAAHGGWNGGGTSFASTATDPAAGGGGATDIRLNGNTLYDRIIVAGGGGGGGEDSEQGGYGGGESGSGSYASTQTSSGTGGVFGIGASTPYDGGAGGGGWYGAGAAGGSQTIPVSNSTSDNNGGSGGSGYVWTESTASYAPSGYNVPASYYLQDAQTIAGNASMPNPNGGTMTGRAGNGYARITYSTFVRDNCASDLIPVTLTVSPVPDPVVEVRSACAGTPSELVVTNALPDYIYIWNDGNEDVFEGTTFTPTVSTTTTYYVRAAQPMVSVTDFEYTGSVQPYVVPNGVTQVLLEVWGAQGGTAPGYTEGGRGGYSVGEMAVAPGTTLNVYVGGEGTYGSNAAGGFNGGGLGYSSNSRTMTSGGGATDIRVNSTSLYSRVIVAGGGGGGYETGVDGNGSTGGYGGGLTGGIGTHSASYPNRVGQGGTQTSGGAYGTDNSWGGTFYNGAFGVGGYSSAAGYSNGGGGGWYGGGSSTPDAGAGGGSGYVYTSATASNYPSGCLLNSSYYLSEAQTIAGNTSFPAPDGDTEVGHTGNGYARITTLGGTGGCESSPVAVTINPVTPPAFTLTASANSYCDGSSPVVLQVNTNESGLTYRWSDDVEATGSSHEVTPGYTQTYTVFVSNGLCEASESTTITVDAPMVTLTASMESCVEAGTEVTLTAESQSSSQQVSSMNMTPTTTTLTPGTTFSYYDYNGPSASYSNYEDYTQVFNALGNSPISIVFNNKGAESCCDYMYLYDGPSTSAPVLYSGLLYNVPLNSVYTATSGSLTVHFTSDVSNVGSGWDATISVASSLTYAWSTGSSENEITVSPTESTTYTVTVTDNEHTCPTIIDHTVRVNPTVEILPENPMVCPGGTITLTASGTDSYVWSNGATGATQSVPAGYYTVTGVNDDGCSATAETSVSSLSTASAGEIAAGEVCQSDYEITLTSVSNAVGGGNVEYRWTINGITTDWSENPEYTLTAADRTALGTGTFNVSREYRDACGNGSSISAVLTINPPMALPTVTGVTNVFCGQNTTLTASSQVQGNLVYRWYSDPAGQNLVYEGSEFVTPALNATTTYYLQVVDVPVTNIPFDFDYTGGVQSWTVPAGVSQLQLEIWGANGGGSSSSSYGTYLGGIGGYSVAEMNVSEGQTLNIYVGGVGQSGTASSGTPQGGWNGGGNGGYGSSYSYGGAGGGATDIRLGGSALANRILVAGGGGGAGYGATQNAITGGLGGATSGTQGNVSSSYSSRLGGAATQSGGGAAGAESYPGTAGSLGQGGNANTSTSCSYGGGGGGGGYYGGGGAGGGSPYAGAGGGGSGYVASSLTGQTMTYENAPANPNDIGNGYARVTITQMTVSDGANCPSELLPVTITVNQIPAPVVEVRSACADAPSELVVTNALPDYIYIWNDGNEDVFTGEMFTPTVSTSTTYYVRAAEPMASVTDFTYTGSTQTYTVPSGVSQVRLEVWGAQGGDATNGGNGGYSVGTLNVVPGDVLNVYVGGQGTIGTSGGGYNGGGSSTYDTYYGGGGATDIRINGSTLYHRVIVAGGGGGYRSSGYTPGVGGGNSGTDAVASSYPGYGATQTAGGYSGGNDFGSGYVTNGSFGLGGTMISTVSGFAGGGGGWYGGGSGHAGGGGSGYVYTSSTASNYPSGCQLNSSYYLTDAQTIAGNTAFPAPNGGTETGHTGNGYARITTIGGTGGCESSAVAVTINPVTSPAFTLTASANSYCDGSSPVVFQVNTNESGLTYRWSDDDEATDNIHEVTPGHTQTYTVTVSNGTCSVESQPVTIYVDAPEVAITGTDNGECVEAGEEVTLTANINPSAGGQINADEYTLSYSTGTYTNLTNPTYIYSNTTSDGLSGTINFPSGFTFPYCGTDYSTVYVYDGQLRFGTSSMTYNFSEMMASSSYYNLLAAFACDLYVSSNGSVSYQLVTEGGQRAMVVQFKDVTTYSDNSYSTSRNFNFQIKLFENGNIQFCYGSGFPNISGHSTYSCIGINNYNNGVHYNQVTPSSGSVTGQTSGSLAALTDAQIHAITNGTIYTFSPVTADVLWSNGSTEYSITVSPTETTTYTVTVTDDEHICPAIMEYTVRVIPEITISSDPEALCSTDASAVLTASGAESYIWNNASMGAELMVSGPNTYSVTGTDAYGCTANASYDLLAPTFTAGEITTDQVSTCASETEPIVISSIVDGASGGNSLYKWLRNGVEIPNSDVASYIIPISEMAELNGGTYTYTRQFYNGCEEEWVASAGVFTLTLSQAQPIVVSGPGIIPCGSPATLSASGYVAEAPTYRWYTDERCTQLVHEGATFDIPAVGGDITYYVQATDLPPVTETVIDFNYTGNEQSFIIPAGVTQVQLEVWGAQGGDATTTYPGGRGGYATGTYNVTPGQTLYVNVGGMGQDYTTPHTGNYLGGYNGGGNGNATSSSSYRTGGGGATHVATASGVLRNLNNNRNSVLIVAGGGGGNLNISGNAAGAGGGSIGISGTGSSYGTGGTQSECGTCTSTSNYSSTFADGGFGYGGGAFGTVQYTLCGGGGGWFGGGFGNGGGGGSSYIGGVFNGNTIAGNTSMPAPNGGTETGHTGNGFARITLVVDDTQTTNQECPSLVGSYTIHTTTPEAPVVVGPSEIPCGAEVTYTIDQPVPGLNYQWSTDANFENIVNTGESYTMAADQNTTLYVRSFAGFEESVIDFDYTGSVQSLTVPAGVTQLQLEVWGAQGGNCIGSSSSVAETGAKGGYSVGTISVNSGDVLNVYVGGAGASNVAGTTGNGGFNGGGYCYSATSGGSQYTAGSGGGATDIRLNSTSLYARAIVAGGGGGTSNGGSTAGRLAGVGGGTNGGTALITPAYSGDYVYATGGTATSGGTYGYCGNGAEQASSSYNGSFGQGGSPIGASSYSFAGGGGGWYGGGASAWGPGGGGSGYVYTASTASNYPSGCLLNSSYYLSDAQTIAGNVSFPAPDGGTEVGHAGNGYARITMVGASSGCESETAVVNITVTPMPLPIVNVESACVGMPSHLVVTNANSGYEYIWSDANDDVATGPEFSPTVSSPTTYWVRCTSEYACSPTLTQVVVNPVAAPEFSVSASSYFYCASSEDPVTLSVVNPAGNYTYAWSTGEAAQSIDVHPTETTTYTVTASNGCGYAMGVTVVVGDAPQAELAASVNGSSIDLDNYCILPGQTLTLGVEGGLNSGSSHASEYMFNVRQETFQTLSGGTTCISGYDDSYPANIPIGFTFNYCGTDYTTISQGSSNGFLQLGNTSASYTNDLASSTYYNMLAPYWDDLYGTTVMYQTTGTAPNRVFTFQHYGYRLSYGDYPFYYQVKLYETSNVIEFWYGSGFSAFTSSVSPTASIGINNYSNGQIFFQSVTPTGPGAATVSTSTSNNNITWTESSYLTSGTVYSFMPVPPCQYEWNTGATTSSIDVNPLQNETYRVTVSMEGMSCTTVLEGTVVTPPAMSQLVVQTQSVECGQTADLTATVSPQAGQGPFMYYLYADADCEDLLSVSSDGNFTTPQLTTGTHTFYAKAQAYRVDGIDTTWLCYSNEPVSTDVVVSDFTAPAVTGEFSVVCGTDLEIYPDGQPDADLTYRWYADADATQLLSEEYRLLLTGQIASEDYYLRTFSMYDGEDYLCGSSNISVGHVTVDPLPATSDPYIEADEVVNICRGEEIYLYGSAEGVDNETPYIAWYTSAEGYDLFTYVPVEEDLVLTPDTTATYWAATATDLISLNGPQALSTYDANTGIDFGNGIFLDVTAGQTPFTLDSLTLQSRTDEPEATVKVYVADASCQNIATDPTQWTEVTATVGATHVGAPAMVRLEEPLSFEPGQSMALYVTSRLFDFQYTRPQGNIQAGTTIASNQLLSLKCGYGYHYFDDEAEFPEQTPDVRVYRGTVHITAHGTPAFGCVSQTRVPIQIVVDQPSEAPSSVTASNTSICNGDAVTLIAHGDLGDNAYYEWYAGEEQIEGATDSIVEVSPEETTIYSVRIVSTYCEPTDAAEVTITVNAPMELSQLTQPEPICHGAALALDAPTIVFQHVNHAITAQGWEVSADGEEYEEYMNAESVPFSDSGLYIRYMVANDCAVTYSNAVVLRVDSLPVVAAVGEIDPLCDGSMLTLPEEPAYTANAEEAEGMWTIAVDQGDPVEYTPDMSFEYGSTYYLGYVVENHCGATQAEPNVVVVKALPTFSANLTIPEAVCEGNGLDDVLVVPNHDNYGTSDTIRWVISSEYQGDYEPFDPSAPVSFEQNGYFVKCVIATECGTVESNAVAVTVNAAPTVGTLASVTLCPGAELNPTIPTIVENGEALTNYGWQRVDGTVEDIELPQTVDYDGWNGAHVRYAAGNLCGTSYSNEMIVTVRRELGLEVSAAYEHACAGGAVELTATSELSGATYAWSSDADGGLNTDAGQIVTASGTMGTHTYTVTATDLYRCSATGSVDVTFHTYESETEVTVCAGDLPYTATDGTTSYTLTESGHYDLTFPMENSACDSTVHLDFTVRPVDVRTERHGLCGAGDSYYWEVTGETYTEPVHETVRVPYQTGAACDSIVYELIVTEGEPYFVIDNRHLTAPATQPMSTDMLATSDCDQNRDARAAVEFELYKDGEPIRAEEYGTLNISTDIPSLDLTFGRGVLDATGSIPGTTFSMYDYNYDYFYVGYLNTAPHHVTATWNEPGEYKLVLRYVLREGGQDYAYQSVPGQVIGGAGSHTTTIVANDTIYMTVTDAETPATPTEPDPSVDGMIDIDTTVFAEVIGGTSVLPVDVTDIAGIGTSDGTKVALDYEVYRDGELVSNVADYGTLNFATYYDQMGSYVGRNLTAGSGSIPQSTFRVIYYQYGYFYLDFLSNTTSRLTATWNEPGEYKVKFTLRLRESGQDYPLTYGDDNRLVGGGGSTAGTLLDEDSVVFRMMPEPVEVTLDTVVCDVPFLFHGESFTESTVTDVEYVTGVYDTIVHLNLTVGTPYGIDIEETSCGSYEWHGETYTESGSYDWFGQSVLGCDSVVTLHLTVFQPTHESYTAEACGEYLWDVSGETYTTSGDHLYAHEDANGCEQVDTLHLTIHTPAHEAYTVDACGGYEWNGETYYESGDYTFEHQTDNYGCTQVDTLHLTVHTPAHEAYTVDVCGGYEWNGETYDESGDYTYEHEDANGCTQVDTLHLTILTPAHEAYTVDACGEYEWNGTIYDESGDYTFEHQTDNYGCTQVDTLHLTIHTPAHEAYTVDACGGYEWNGETYDESGDYTYEHQTDNYGCTQVDTLHLTIHTPAHEAYTVDACGEYEWNGTVYDQSGDYTYTHPTDNYGCERVDTLHLTVNPTYDVEVSETVGVGELPYLWNGQELTMSGTWTASLQTAAGCDSIVTLTLTVNGLVEGEPVISTAEVDDATFTFTVFADAADGGRKVSVDYHLYKDNVLVDDIATECGGLLNIGTPYNGGYMGQNLTTGEGNLPENTFMVGGTHYDYLYLHFLAGRANRVTHGFTEPGSYTLVFELVEEEGGSDFATTYTVGGETRRIGGKNSVGGNVLATTDYQFTVEGPAGESESGLPMLTLSTSSVTTATSTVTLTCEQNDYDPTAKVAIRYVIKRDGEMLSDVVNAGSINLSTQVASMNNWYGKTVTEATGTIPGSTFRPVPTFIYNYFYMDFLAATENRITATWNEGGNYSIDFDLLLMQGGSDLSINWSAGHRIGGKNATSTGTVLASATLNYEIPASAAPTGIGENADSQSIAVWPNPARDVVNVTVPDTYDGGEIEIVDMSGRVVARLNARDTASINVSTWSAGVYFVNVRTADTVVTEKFVVTK